MIGGVIVVVLASAGRAAAQPAQAPPSRTAQGAMTGVPVMPPRQVGTADVAYPAGARGDAVVVLIVLVDASGAVGDVTPSSGDEPFVSAAVAAARAWKFDPATRDGAPLAARIKMEIAFRAPVAIEPEVFAPAPSPGAADAAPPATAPIVDEVDVRGQRPAPGATSMGRAEVRQLPGAFGDPFRALDALPGVTPIVSGLPFFSNGGVTADGWSVVFERVLVGIGRASLGNTCSRYSDSSYDRLLDVTSKSGQKLSILYGIGQCDLRFRVAAPSSDVVLGEGVTEEQKTELRTPGGDAYVPLGGIAMDLTGAATRDGVTKRFHLVFRPRVRYANCGLGADAGSGVDMRSEVEEVFDIRIEAEAVLRDDVDAATASLRFEPFAAADRDGDGLVTLEELRAVPIASVRDSGAFEAGVYDFDDDAGVFRQGKAVAIESLGDYVYELLLPSLPRFRGTGGCGAGVGRGRGPG